MSSDPQSRPNTRFSLVTHCFWRYPVLALVLALAVALLGFTAGSPFWPRATIAKVAAIQPGGTVWAVAQQLDGSSASNTIAMQPGIHDPAEALVIKPLQSAKWTLSSAQNQALAEYLAAAPAQQQKWAMNYDNAIKKGLGIGSGGGMGDLTPVPKMEMINELKGNFGPVPVMAKTILELAGNGYLETYFQGVSPYHVYQYTNIWLYDEPHMLNTAIHNGLTDDQWGMIKERGYPVGPWYLIFPAIAHVLLPSGSTGPGFIFWNGVIAIFFVVIFPLIPGLRDIPDKLKLYRFVYAVDPKDTETDSDQVKPAQPDA
jgi:hypothetical protein